MSLIVRQSYQPSNETDEIVLYENTQAPELILVSFGENSTMQEAGFSMRKYCILRVGKQSFRPNNVYVFQCLNGT